MADEKTNVNFREEKKENDDEDNLISLLPNLELQPVMFNPSSSNFPSPTPFTSLSEQPSTHHNRGHFVQKSNQWQSAKDLDLGYISGGITGIRSRGITGISSIGSPRSRYDNLNNFCSPSIMRKISIKSAQRKKKGIQIQAQGTDRNLVIGLLGIGYDSQFGFDEEEEDIKKSNFEFDRSVLTINDFKKVLIESPPIVHISTHGMHQYTTVDKQNEFQVSLEEPQTLRYLIDDEPKFSAYYAVIALLFEMEINHFVQYGFDKIAINHSLKTWLWKDEKKYALLCNGKIYAMLVTILDRFGCFYRENTRIGIGYVEIFWGKYKYKELNEELIFICAPHPPMDSYQLCTLLKHDDQVQEILKDINDDYNKSLRQNIKIAKDLDSRKYQKFSWEILSILLQRLLADNFAEPDDSDDTQWIKPSTQNINANEDKKEDVDVDVDIDVDADELAAFGFGLSDDAGMSDIDVDELAAFGFGGDEDDEDEDVNINNDNNYDDEKDDDDDDDDDDDEWERESFHSDEDSRITQIKFGRAQELTRELKVIPINIKRTELKNDPIEMQQLIQKVSHFKNKVVRLLKKTPDIQIHLDVGSRSSSNIHIIKFANRYALTLAKHKIDKIKVNSKYNHDYDIQFRSVSKADYSTKKQVGFIKKGQEKRYSIDVRNKTDPISIMLKKHLKSKKQCTIKLLILNGCHSFILGKIFSEYVENVICIHPFVKIWDTTATTFTRHFYQSLHEYTNPRTQFSHSVLKAYNAAQTNVAKDCSNDFACVSHSHSHPVRNHHHIEYQQRRQQQFHQLHLRENWQELQNHINDEQLFRKYRQDMKRFGVLSNEPMEDLHDGKTLIISNISIQQMHDLREYLEDLKPTKKQINNIKKEEKEEEKFDDNDDDDDDEEEKEDFVKQAIYQQDEHYEELSVAYFKFKSSKHRQIAKKILSQKQYDEQLVFSEQILLKSHMQDDDDDDDDGKEESKQQQQQVSTDNLGWIVRVVPRCCCSPHHPHIAQDKLLLIQNGNIINRSIINDISQIKHGLDEMRQLHKQRQEMKKKRQIQKKASIPIDKVPRFEIGAESSSCSDQQKDLEELNKQKSVNNFGMVDKSKSKPQNFKNDSYFGNSFESKLKKKKNNFASKTKKNNFASKTKKNNFGESKRKKTNSFSDFNGYKLGGNLGIQPQKRRKSNQFQK